jgi:ribose transport system permease protein
MIFTLGMNAVMRELMVAHTGGFAPQTRATDLMRALAAEHVYGAPNALFVWLAVTAIVAVMRRRIVLGRSIYAPGNKESAAYLAGVNTKRVTVVCFAPCGVTAGLAGVSLAGYSQNAYQGRATPTFCPRSPLSSSAALTFSAGAATISARWCYVAQMTRHFRRPFFARGALCNQV